MYVHAGCLLGGGAACGLFTALTCVVVALLLLTLCAQMIPIAKAVAHTRTIITPVAPDLP